MPKTMSRSKFQWSPSALELFSLRIGKPKINYSHREPNQQTSNQQTSNQQTSNQQTSGLLELPTELLLIIASFISRFRDLNSLIRTHSRLAVVVSPILYRKALVPVPNGIGAPYLLRSFVFSENYNGLDALLNVYNADPNQCLDITAKRWHWSPLLQPREQSLLHLAVTKENTAIARLLLEAGMKTNVTDSTGTTPLHMASQTGNLEMMNILLSYGADLEAIDSRHRTPFFVATCCNKVYGRAQAVQTLLTAGANPDVLARISEECINFRTGFPVLEWSALHFLAVKSNYISDDEMIGFLVKHGANVELPLPGTHPPCTPLALLTEILFWFKLELELNAIYANKKHLEKEYRRRLRTVEAFFKAGADIGPALLALQSSRVTSYGMFELGPLFPVHSTPRPDDRQGNLHIRTVAELDNAWEKAGELVKVDLERVQMEAQRYAGGIEGNKIRQTAETLLRGPRNWLNFLKQGRS